MYLYALKSWIVLKEDPTSTELFKLRVSLWGKFLELCSNRLDGIARFFSKYLVDNFVNFGFQIVILKVLRNLLRNLVILLGTGYRPAFLIRLHL